MFRLMLLFSLLATTVALPRPLDRGPVRPPHRSLDVNNPQDESIALFNHLVATNVTNSGYWGIDGFSATPEDTVYCDWRYVPGLEYPFGSGIQLLFQAALWIGAEIETDSGYVPRVSVGSDGWQNPSINEFHAGQRPNHGIILRSNLLSATDCYGNRLYDPSARANYEAISVYTDTLTDPIFVEGSPIDGDHLPLGLEVTQTARLWVNPEYSGFVIHEFRIRNIGAHNLRNVYLGLYTDSDIGRIGSNNEHTDDLSGSILVDSAQGKILGWSADNDGYPVNWFGQQALATHHALGIVAMTNQFTTTDREFAQSFNWWSPNANISLDLGPSWEESPIRWEVYGSPGQDADRYYLLSNRERDYDQAVIFGPIEPQVDTFYSCVSDGNFHLWRSLVDTIFAVDLVDGNDTRFLLSYGPLGELDHFDDEGQCVTRLSPGEEFTFTVAQLAGHNFHDPEHPQPLPYNIDTTLFDFTGLLDSYHKAQRIYNSNYEFQPMPPVENLRVPRALDSAVPLRWDPPGFGNPYGYLVAGNPHSGASDTVLFTPTPIQDRTYTVTGLDNDSHWQFIVIAVDSEGNQVAHDTIVHVGAIPNFSELHGKAFAHGDSLWWDVSNDPLKAGYTLVRTSASDTVTYSSILTRTFLDTAVVSGRAYTYRMYIDCVTAVQSEPTNAITLTPYRPTANILIFDETRRPIGGDL